MKNSHLKNSLVAASIAVFAGVVTLGVNVAFGDTAPTLKPADTTLVAPTFNGLTVTGNANVNGLDSKGAITNSTGKLILNSPSNGVDINGAANVSGNLTATANTIIKGTLDIAGIIQNTALNAPVIINDIEGLRLTSGDLDVWGTIKNNTGNPVQIDGDLTVNASNLLGILSKAPLGTGAIKANSLDVQAVYNTVTSGGLGVPFQVGDDLKVTGASEFMKQVTLDDNVGIGMKPTTGAKLQIAGSGAYNAPSASRFDLLNTLYGTPWFTHVGDTGLWQVANGSSTKLAIAPTANGETDFYNGTGNVIFNGSGNVGIGTNTPQYTLDVKGDLNVGDTGKGTITVDTISNHSGLYTIPLNVSGGLAVAGKVTATNGFGKYSFRESPVGTIAASSNGYQLASCNVGEQAVSCYGNAYSSSPTAGNFYSGEVYDVNITGLYPYTGKCEVNYKNTSVSTRYIKAGALCLDPAAY